MTPRRLWKAFTAPRTTVALLVLLAVMLLLNVTLPQEAVLGSDEFLRQLTGRPWAVFFLVTLGLGRLATSPLFVAVLALFFTNLAAVLLARLGPTWRRSRLRPRSGRGLEAWAHTDESLSAPLPDGWDTAGAVAVLRGHGYRVRRVGDGTFWGVKHRTAPLGFLLFHLSFFLLCAGGVTIYLTRFVGTAVVVEGQEFRGDYQQIQRHAPWSGPPALAFVVEEVEPRFVAGEPVHLGARLSFRTPGAPVVRQARVNHPAHWGDTAVLVQGAGLAPVLWLQDAQGFTVDRVAASARTRVDPMAGLGAAEATEVPLAGGRLVAVIAPLAPGVPFPHRGELGSTAVGVEVLRAGDEAAAPLFEGTLEPGRGAALTTPDGRVEGRLVLAEVRYWAGLQVVRERGGGLLVAGFTAGVLGLIWRLLLHRREVVMSWDRETVRLVGRGEHFGRRFERELAALFADLCALAGEGRKG